MDRLGFLLKFIQSYTCEEGVTFYFLFSSAATLYLVYIRTYFEAIKHALRPIYPS